MIICDCSEHGAPDYLIRAIFHFTWRKGDDGGKVTTVSTFSDPLPCLDCFFPPLVIAQAFDTPNETVRAR